MNERDLIRHKTNMKHAYAQSDLSTCQYTQVGVVLVDPTTNQIVSTGYNGTSSGHVHCTDLVMDRDEHLKFSNKFEIHAEVNAVTFAGKNGKSTLGTVCYSTTSPCWHCVGVLKSAGVSKVYFANKYWRLDDAELEEMSLGIGIELEYFPLC